MRPLLVLLRNVISILLVVLALPMRALRTRRRPEWVRFRLKGDPPYRALRQPWAFFRRPEPGTVKSLNELRGQLEQLIGDPKLKGVVVELEGFTGPSAKRLAFAELLQRVRAAGKQVVGYAVSAGNGEYELLCAADRVLMAPAGRLELTGYSAEASAIGQGLRQVGITAHFVRRGEHKTAPELFTRDEVSPIQRKTLETILEERYSALVDAISSGRKLSVEEARLRIDEGPYSAKRAQAQGLIDALVSEADLAHHLGGEKTRVADYASYAATLLVRPGVWKRLLPRPRLAVVPLSGMIVQGKGGGAAPFGPKVAGSETVVKSLRAAVRDGRSRAVLLYIDSPGGSAMASEVILEEVKRTAGKKPVVAYFDEVAASGGYMAALGAQEVWAAPHAIAGSIGVFAGKFDLSGLLERLGVRRSLVTRGRNAAIFSSSRPFTETERDALEAEVEETYQAFLEHVAHARKRTREEIHQKAEGRIYSGTAALAQGLVDQVGSFEGACLRALELSGVPSPDFEVALFAPPTPRLPLLRVLRKAGAERMFALWYPWVEFPDR